MILLIVVVLDECSNLGLEVASQKVVFEEDAVLLGPVPMVDLALGLRMKRVNAHMAHLPGLKVCR